MGKRRQNHDAFGECHKTLLFFLVGSSLANTHGFHAAQVFASAFGPKVVLLLPSQGSRFEPGSIDPSLIFKVASTRSFAFPASTNPSGILTADSLAHQDHTQEIRMYALLESDQSCPSVWLIGERGGEEDATIERRDCVYIGSSVPRIKKKERAMYSIEEEETGKRCRTRNA